jgi:alkylhydroperoxidase/carboxymuconolactone decarboxylase family protein YurZ
VVAALVALGGLEARLRTHVRWALDHGATAEELEALGALLAVYVGYARASVAMEAIREVVAEEGRG